MHFKVVLTTQTPMHSMYLRKYFDDLKTRGHKIMNLLLRYRVIKISNFCCPQHFFFLKMQLQLWRLLIILPFLIFFIFFSGHHLFVDPVFQLRRIFFQDILRTDFFFITEKRCFLKNSSNMGSSIPEEQRVSVYIEMHFQISIKKFLTCLKFWTQNLICSCHFISLWISLPLDRTCKQVVQNFHFSL